MTIFHFIQIVTFGRILSELNSKNNRVQKKGNGKTKKENRILCLVHINSKVGKVHAVVAAATAVKCTKKRENTAVAVLLD